MGGRRVKIRHTLRVSWLWEEINLHMDIRIRWVDTAMPMLTAAQPLARWSASGDGAAAGPEEAKSHDPRGIVDRIRQRSSEAAATVALVSGTVKDLLRAVFHEDRDDDGRRVSYLRRIRTIPHLIRAMTEERGEC